MKPAALLAELGAILTASPVPAGPEKKPAPLVACIEPSLLRTDTSQLIPGSKKTVITPARRATQESSGSSRTPGRRRTRL